MKTILPHKDLTLTIPSFNSQTKQGNWDISKKPKTSIVLHTMGGTLAGTDSWFSRPTTIASAHYGVGLNGEIHRYVDEEYTSYANGIYDLNQTSITIETEDKNKPNDIQRTNEQTMTVAQLVRDICLRWNIPIDRNHIKGHREVNPASRKTCPGNLPMDEIVKLANIAPVETVAPTPVNNDAATKYLNEQLVLRGFGNIEGMCRALFEDADRYRGLIKPDASGKPPIMVPHTEYVNLSIKARSLDKVADVLGEPEVNRIDPSFGDKIIANLRGVGGNPTNQLLDLGNSTNRLSEQQVSLLTKVLNFFRKDTQ